MTEENIFYTPGKEYSIWSSYILEECAGFMVYPITVLAILILLYYPLIFAFSCFYATSLVLHVWKKIGNLPEDTSSKQWDMPRKIYALVTDLFGKILHSYEISGLENLPEGPAILVYYHGAFPIDYHCFVIRLYRLTGRFCYSVVDHVISLLPGKKLLCLGFFKSFFFFFFSHSIPPHATPLLQQTQRAIEDLRDKHQKIPGSILYAFKQRFEAHNKDK
ncbi:monoacylglycerol/Diacylglycerol O-acyltransferase-like [Pantherophis guttatus]|uniref:Monoacylglycerol/Diacylglycerol O-acyltransferase-like n=1 Tax=Pantherophis guttatus TaxID=94885 RepID=A0ABM3YPR5_PANGU|nr:monoacylglycerol/Diacylglycerol O-acyltransferase-like [Pantherophis guttatus]